MKFLNTIVTATAVSCLSLFTLTPVAGQSAKEILDSNTATALPSEVSDAAIHCKPLKVLQCSTKAYPVLTALMELRLDSGQEKILPTVREALSLIDDCWTCVADEKQKAAICAALRYAGDLLEVMEVPFPLPSECGGSGVAPRASTVSTGAAVAATGEVFSFSEEELVAKGGQLVNPCPDGCCNFDFDFFNVVAHKGKLCGEINGFDYGVQAKGEFKVLGKTLYTYDEWIGRNEKKCLPSFTNAGLSYSPCFDFRGNPVELCVQQRICSYYLGCRDMGRICTSFAVYM